jgi:hypothetical protein
MNEYWTALLRGLFGEKKTADKLRKNPYPGKIPPKAAPRPPVQPRTKEPQIGKSIQDHYDAFLIHGSPKGRSPRRRKRGLFD